MVNRIDPPELQLNKANTSDTEASFWICIYLFATDLFHIKFIISKRVQSKKRSSIFSLFDTLSAF